MALRCLASRRIHGYSAKFSARRSACRASVPWAWGRRSSRRCTCRANAPASLAGRWHPRPAVPRA
ncbi:MAG: hypothetical protein CFE44_10920, partial [Burkholderiales bacterium PBB4]